MAHAGSLPAHPGTVTGEEVRAMARVLARRYGGEAVDIALHFAYEHEAVGDLSRAGIWNRVAERLLRNHSAPTLS